MSKISKKGNNSKIILKKISQNFTKYFSHHPLSADTSFKFLSLILFEIWHLQNLISIFSKGRNFTRGDNSKKKIHVYYFSMRNLYMKFQDDISFQNIIVAKFQGPKFWKRAITQKISYEFFQFFVKYSIYHPLSADTSFKFLAIILFEIRHLQNVIPLFVKGP